MLTRGLVANKPKILESRALSRADLARIPQKRADSGMAMKLRSHHHRIARLDAAGLMNYQICEICDITDSRIQQLRKTPAYVELVAAYRHEIIKETAQQVDEYTRIAMSNMLRAEEQIKDHIDEAEEEGELIPLKTLLAVTSDRADRFGYPKGKVVATINMGSALEKAMVRSGRTITVDAKGNPPALASRGSVSSQPALPRPSLTRVSRRGF